MLSYIRNSLPKDAKEVNGVWIVQEGKVKTYWRRITMNGSTIPFFVKKRAPYNAA